jgi:hypothetical protein
MLEKAVLLNSLCQKALLNNLAQKAVSPLAAFFSFSQGLETEDEMDLT